MSSVETSLDRFVGWLDEAGLNTKEYQKEGLKRMVFLENDDEPLYGCRGGFLADEMGLGKTIQMLGLILCNPVGRTLIVVPRALLDQWETAMIKFLGHHPLVYHGTRKEEKDIKSSPVVLTTYGTAGTRMTKDGKEINSPLIDLSWGRVIYDEAHHMRNSKTGSFIGASKLKAKFKWFVTGTPIQNSVGDIYSLMRLFGIDRDIYGMPEGLRRISQHFCIRRTKKEVGIDLVPVKKHHIKVSWETDEELNLASDIHSTISFSKITAGNVDKLIAYLTHHHLPALLRMRQSCIHMGMLKNAATKMLEHGLLEESDVRDGLHRSSKMNAVLKTLDERKENKNNKIVFCHFHFEIDLLQAKLTEMGLKVAVVDGRTPGSERDMIFTSVYDVLILQIQSSCEGLNLQSYNEIYFTSPHWNPAVVDQAIARAHRIGQEKEVHVFEFEMDGFDEGTLSIDTYCFMIQKKKREMMSMF